MKLPLLPSAALALLTACTAVSSDAPPSVVLGARVYIEADYDDVWARFIEAEAFADWYTAPCVQFGTEPGDELLWKQGDADIYRGSLAHIEKGEGISWDFRFVCFDWCEPMTRAEFTVVQRGPTVLVSVRHDVTGAPRTSEVVSPVGWAKPLSRLKTLLETGQPMQWPIESEE